MKRMIPWEGAAPLTAQLAPATTSLLCLIALLLASPSAHAIPTEVGGQQYVDECKAAGVPEPPPWTSPKWIFRGAMTRTLNPHDPDQVNGARTFISRDKLAEVYYYD